TSSAFQISMRMRSSGCSCWYFVLVINHTLPNGKVLHFKFEAARKLEETIFISFFESSCHTRARSIV
ncbi:hypothetical protein, partial [Cupriavidus sp.]|uniref:hypothetical protein n=1 Tax=Cupriavidus sp. TaxID=1873897 RepID=UPI0031DB1734